MSSTKVLIVGAGGREHALGAALARSEAQVFVAAPTPHPGLKRLSRGYKTLRVEDGAGLAAWARQIGAGLAVLGPDAAVASGVADSLRAAGVPAVGPGASAARIESSKAFARDLMARHSIPGLPKFRSVRSAEEIAPALAVTGEPFVVKPSWLTAGKGVWVQGVDFATREEGTAYAKRLFAEGRGEPVVLEERLEGEEFSLMAFVDGKTVHPMPVVQDYKRALEGDKGGNTGGMGSYSLRDGRLPFLSEADLTEAVDILQRTVSAMREEGLEYRGILYGGFMATRQGVHVIEFNARFGDPEALNVLTVFDGTDFSELLAGVAGGHVDPVHVRFRKRATVVKYLVPPGYGSSPKPGGILTLSPDLYLEEGVTLYYGSVTPGPKENQVVMGTSRGLALVGEGSALKDAYARVEEAVKHVQGTFEMRHDIANAVDVARRTDHVRTLRGLGPKLKELNRTRSGPEPPHAFT